MFGSLVAKGAGVPWLCTGSVGSCWLLIITGPVCAKVVGARQTIRSRTCSEGSARGGKQTTLSVETKNHLRTVNACKIMIFMNPINCKTVWIYLVVLQAWKQTHLSYYGSPPKTCLTGGPSSKWQRSSCAFGSSKSGGGRLFGARISRGIVPVSRFWTSWRHTCKMRLYCRRPQHAATVGSVGSGSRLLGQKWAPKKMNAEVQELRESGNEHVRQGRNVSHSSISNWYVRMVEATSS